MTFCRSPFELSPLELASGIVLGLGAEVEPDVDAETEGAPLMALEDAVLPALLCPPCVVSFSGGRDSSAVLAVAASVARREGLPLPIAATNVFPGVPRASEAGWQELVIRHLEIDDWVRLDNLDELDCVGPVATSILRRHGLLWPFNAHFHWPLLEIAQGGSLLTGIGGDELLGTSQWSRAARILAGSARPVPRDLIRVSVALAPQPLRAIALRRRTQASFSWLTQEANECLTRTYASELAGEPLRWSRRWSWWRRRRQVGVGFKSLELLAADHDVAIAHPLTDRRFVFASTQLASRRGIFERTELMQALFGGVLPAALLERRSKAAFDEIFWSDHSRRFAPAAVSWLQGCDTVDRDGLESVWRSPVPDPHSLLLLQALLVRDLDAMTASGVRQSRGTELDHGGVVGVESAT